MNPQVPLSAGRLDQRITISARVVTGQNSYGEDVYGAPVNVSLWADVDYLQGRELERAQQIHAEARYRITIRRQPGLTIKREDSMTWRGNTLDIVDVMNQGTREDHWEMLAKDHVQ